MHEQLIEALREEAKSLQKDGYGLSAAGDVPARFVEMLKNLANRLEGVAKSSEPRPKHLPKGLHVPPSSSWSVMGEAPTHMRDGYITGPTAPPVITGYSQDDSLDIRCSVSHATTDPANDDDEPLTAEWLQEVMPDRRIQHGIYWTITPSDEAGYSLAIRCKANTNWENAWHLNVTTRGEYRSLRKMLGIPMEGA